MIYRDRVDGPVALQEGGFVGDRAARPYHGGPDADACVHLLDHFGIGTLIAQITAGASRSICDYPHRNTFGERIPIFQKKSEFCSNARIGAARRALGELCQRRLCDRIVCAQPKPQLKNAASTPMQGWQALNRPGAPIRNRFRWQTAAAAFSD